MSIAYIIGALVTLVLSYFGFNHYKNKQALKDNYKAKEEVAGLGGEIGRILDEMEQERATLEEMKKAYQEKLGRELTDEEISNFFNSRYNRQ